MNNIHVAKVTPVVLFRPDFFTLYLEEPDKSGHSFGPVSGGVRSKVKGHNPTERGRVREKERRTDRIQRQK